MPTETTYSWNGPICNTCGRGYIGAHRCAPEHLQAQIDFLTAKLAEVRKLGPLVRTPSGTYSTSGGSINGTLA